MMIPLKTLQELLKYHYERRERIYGLMEQLTPEEFVRPMNVGWDSVRGILVHCLWAEDFWVQHATQGKARPPYRIGDFADIASVKRLAAEVRQRTEAYVAGLSEADMGREHSVTYSSGYVLSFTLSQMFLHVITHDTHHRGQVSLLARQMGYEPPEIDLM